MPYSKPEPGKPILIEVDGQMLEVRYSLKTLKVLDTEHQLSVLKGGFGTAIMDPGKLALILYLGLREKNPATTLDWVEEKFDASMLMDLFPVLAFATTGRWVELGKAARELPNVEEPIPTGSPSGQ